MYVYIVCYINMYIYIFIIFNITKNYCNVCNDKFRNRSIHLNTRFDCSSAWNYIRGQVMSWKTLKSGTARKRYAINVSDVRKI